MPLETTLSQSLTIDAEHHTLFRHKERGACSSPRDWLASVACYPKWYMRTSANNEYAACGALKTFSHLPSVTAPTFDPHSPRVIGGQDFFSLPRKSHLWSSFPQSLYALPLYECYTDGTVAWNALTKQPSPPPLEEKASASTPLLHIRYDTPSKEGWCESLSACIHEMKALDYEKIVLGRATHFTFHGQPNPHDLLHHLATTTMNAVVFMVQLSPTVAFLGATPEYLFDLSKQTLETHAIAGTRRRGTNHAQDQALEKELLESHKERSEFSYVYKEIERCLHPICTSFVRTQETKVIKTSSVQHLHQRFVGELKEGITPFLVCNALHPTPAVGGFPRETALQKIYGIESFDRGWYAAPFGYSTDGESKMIVAIRSALIDGPELTAFAGTGTVASSDPHLEWEELNNKISQFVQWIE